MYNIVVVCTYILNFLTHWPPQALFQKVWTTSNIFGWLSDAEIKWNLTPPKEFLPNEFGALNATPILINRLSPSPNVEAEFATLTNFPNMVNEIPQNAGCNWRHPPCSKRGAREPHGTRNPNSLTLQKAPHCKGEHTKMSQRRWIEIILERQTYHFNTRRMRRQPIQTHGTPTTLLNNLKRDTSNHMQKRWDLAQQRHIAPASGALGVYQHTSYQHSANCRIREHTKQVW